MSSIGGGTVPVVDLPETGMVDFFTYQPIGKILELVCTYQNVISTSCETSCSNYMYVSTDRSTFTTNALGWSLSICLIST